MVPTEPGDDPASGSVGDDPQTEPPADPPDDPYPPDQGWLPV